MIRLNRRLAIGALMSVGLVDVHAQERRTYAALSLIGGELTVITLQASVGSHTDTSEREKISMPDSAIDEAAVRSIERILISQGHTPPLLLVPGGKPFYAEQSDMVSRGRFTPNAALRPVIDQLKGQATHLLLLTRQRSGGGLRGGRLPNGPRTLEGLGFCLDASWRDKRGNAVVDASGLLAPFASFRLSVIDLSSSLVLKGETLSASTHLPTPPGHSSPWASLPDVAKMEGLNGLVRAELERALPVLLGD